MTLHHSPGQHSDNIKQKCDHNKTIYRELFFRFFFLTAAKFLQGYFKWKHYGMERVDVNSSINAKK